MEKTHEETIRREAYRQGWEDCRKEAVRVIEGEKVSESPLHDAHRFYQVKDFNNGLSTAISTLEGLDPTISSDKREV